MTCIPFCQHYKVGNMNNRQYCLVKNPEKNEDCLFRDGVRAGRGSPCAVLLPFSMAASSL